MRTWDRNLDFFRRTVLDDRIGQSNKRAMSLAIPTCIPFEKTVFRDALLEIHGIIISALRAHPFGLSTLKLKHATPVQTQVWLQSGEVRDSVERHLKRKPIRRPGCPWRLPLAKTVSGRRTEPILVWLLYRLRHRDLKVRFVCRVKSERGEYASHHPREVRRIEL